MKIDNTEVLILTTKIIQIMVQGRSITLPYLVIKAFIFSRDLIFTPATKLDKVLFVEISHVYNL